MVFLVFGSELPGYNINPGHAPRWRPRPAPPQQKLPPQLKCIRCPLAQAIDPVEVPRMSVHPEIGQPRPFRGWGARVFIHVRQPQIEEVVCFGWQRAQLVCGSSWVRRLPTCWREVCGLPLGNHRYAVMLPTLTMTICANKNEHLEQRAPASLCLCFRRAP